MMLRIQRPFAFTAAILLALPASLSGQALSHDAAAERIVEPEFEQDLMGAIRKGEFERAKQLADSVQPAIAAKPRLKTLFDYFQAIALLGLKREKDARAAIAAAQLDDWNDPYPFIGLIEVGARTDQYGVALDALDRLIARYPDALRTDLREEFVFFLLRKAPKEDKLGREDRTIALARIDFGGSGRAAYLRRQGSGYLLDRGDLEGAEELSREIVDPAVIEEMLVSRRFQRLWPHLAQGGGTHLAQARAENLRLAEANYRARPDDHKAMRLYAGALRAAGRHDEAMALRRYLPQTSETMAKADEEMGWLVNEIAYAFAEAGRWKEADGLFALLNDSVRDESWLISMEINRAELLVSDARDEEARGLLASLEASVKVNGNPYAKQLVRRIKFCLTARSDDRSGIEFQRKDLLDHRKDSFEATVSALLCDKDWVRAEQVALEGLPSDVEFAEQYVRNMQARPLTGNGPSHWKGQWRELRQRPAMAAEFNRLGRDLPPDLLPPQAAFKRPDIQ